jgi:hypothetical protein
MTAGHELVGNLPTPIQTTGIPMAIGSLLSTIDSSTISTISFCMLDDLPPDALAKAAQILRRREKKERASLTLSGEVLAALDHLGGEGQRSALVDAMVRRYLLRAARRSREARDLELLTLKAERLARETDDLMRLQSEPADASVRWDG